MMTTSIGGLNAMNMANWAAYNMMTNSNARLGLLSFRGDTDLRALNNADKRLDLDMLNNGLLYKASLAQEESLKKITDQNIKRTFCMFM